MCIYTKSSEQDGINKLGGRESYSIAQDEPNNGGFRNAKAVVIQIQH